jgi:hypothetical protein
MKTFKEFLNEMPMSLNLVGDDWSQPKDYDRKSTMMLNSDKAKNKIVRRLENVPYDFNVYFVQTKERMHTTMVGKESIDDYYQKMGISPEQAPIVDGKINMFVTKWDLANADVTSPTAWMIIHRFAHANMELANNVAELLTQAGKQLSQKQNDYTLVLGLGTMKSALSGRLGGSDEPAHEIITQYIMNKKINFDPKRKAWVNQNDVQILKQLSNELEQTIGNYLKEATNRVYFIF